MADLGVLTFTLVEYMVFYIVDTCVNTVIGWNIQIGIYGHSIRIVNILHSW